MSAIGGVAARCKRGLRAKMRCLDWRELRFKIGERGISASVAAVPREQHAWVGLREAGLCEIVKRHAGRLVDRVVTCDPTNCARSRRIGRERFENIPIAIAVDFVEADKARRLAVRAYNVTRWKDFQGAASIATAQLFL